MSTSRVQVKRTSTNNSPPTDLLPGELSVEMGTPTRLWVGVPTSADPTKKKLLIDTSVTTDHAPRVHTHVIADTTGLQTALDGKADTVHRHTIADVDGLRTELDMIEAGSNNNHLHQISQILGLQNDLDGKSNVGHTHDFSQITGTLSATNITGFGALATLNTIGTAQIDPLAVTAAQIASHTIDTHKIANQGVMGWNIADSTITWDKIAPLAVTGDRIASHTINGDKIAPGSITGWHITPNTITGDKIALGGDTAGDLMVYNGTDWARLPAGAPGRMLQSAGPGAMPVWAASGGAGSVQIAGTAPLAHNSTTDVAIAGGPYSALRVGYKAVNGSSGATMNVNVQVFDGTTWGAVIPLASITSTQNTKTAEFWIYNTGAVSTPVLYALSEMDDRPDSIPTGVTTLLRFTYGTATSFKLQVKVVGYK